MTRARLAKAVLRTCAVALAVAAALLAGAYALFRTDIGRDALSTMLERALSAPGETVIIEGLRGRLPGEVRAGSISIADARGTWLVVHDAVLVWRPGALLSGRFHAERLEATSVRVLRQPAGGDDGEGSFRLPLDVRVDRIDAGEVVLEDPVLGAPAAFSVTGQLTASEGEVVTALAARRTDGGSGSLRVEVRYDGSRRRLALDLAAEEPEGGLLARALGLPGLPAVSISLAGDGPVSGWRGRLHLAMPGLARADAVLGIAGDGPYSLTMRGTAELMRALDPPLQRFVQGTLTFDGEARWSPEAERLTVSHLTLANKAVRVDARGAIAIASGEVDATVRVRPLARGLLQGLTGPVALEPDSATIVARGTLERPSLDATASFAHMRGAGLASGRGALRLSAEPVSGTEPRWAVDVRAALADLVFADPAMTGLLGERLSARMGGTLDPETAMLADASLELSAAHVAVRGEGTASLETATGEADLSIAVDDLAPLAAALAAPVGGRLTVRTQLAARDGGVRSELSGSFEALEQGDPVLAALLGAAPSFQGSIRVDPSGEVTVSSLFVEGAALKAEAGPVTLSGDNISGAYRATIENLASVAEAAGAPASGTVRLEGRIGGSARDPTLDGTIETSALRWETRALGDATVRYAIRNAVSGPRGSLFLEARTPAGALTGSTNVAMAASGSLGFRDISIHGEGLTLSGRLDLPSGEEAVQGRIEGRIAALRHWTALAGVPVTGSADVEIHLLGRQGRQAADLHLAARDVVPAAGVEIARLTAEITATDHEAGPRVRLRAEAADARLPRATLDRVSLTGEGGVDGFRAEFAAAGEAAGPFEIRGRASAELGGDAMRVTVSDISGHAGGRAIDLQGPAVYAGTGESKRVSLPGLSWGDAAVSLSGETDGRTVSARAQIRDLPASVLSAFVPAAIADGRIDAELALSGAADDPEGRLRVALAGIRTGGGAGAAMPPLDATLTGTLRAGRVEFAGEATGLGKAALSLTGELPLVLTVAPFVLDIPQDRRIDARLSWTGDIAAVAAILPLSEHRLAGPMSVALRAGGTLSDPFLRGSVGWSGGRYENLLTGTVLAEIDMLAELDGERVVLRRLSATDGADGRLSGQGSFGLGATAGAAIDAGLSLQEFTLVRRDDVTATASGTLSAVQTADGLKVEGRIEAGRVEAQLVDALPPEIVKLNVVEINGASPTGGNEDAKREKESASSPVPPVVLDISVVIPRRAFLRGRGLDSEWAGELHVTGTTAAPVLNGVLRPVRGRFDFAGRVFRLEETGRVYFEGGDEIDPRLDVAATFQATGLRAVVQIQGTATRPTISLTSMPELPPDEILSRVLFGKSVGGLSPVETAQLAAAAATTAGISSGPGILDRLRSKLGVDALRVGEDPRGNTTVGVGKYVTEDVFVGVNRGVTEGSGNLSVEVTVIPNVSITTEVGAHADSRVGVNWKWDY